MMSKTEKIYHSFGAAEDSISKAYPIRDIFQSFFEDKLDFFRHWYADAVYLAAFNGRSN